jgi:hypothetical protein
MSNIILQRLFSNKKKTVFQKNVKLNEQLL